MPQPIVQIPWGETELKLSLPQDWQIAGVMEPSSLPPVSNPRAEVERALANPIGSLRMSLFARPDLKIALVIDDISRPTPVSLIAPCVLSELERAGVGRKQITVIPAIGLHRALTAEEIAQRTGIPGLKFENPQCDNPDSMLNLGTTSRGTPVWINRTVAEADLIISIGCIEPHIIASFGGGYKNIVPGVAGRATTAHNHSLNCTPQTFNMVGQPIDSNPMRLDLEEAAGMVKGRLFIVNAILNYCQELVRISAGDPVQAHRQGVEISAELYRVRIPQPADIVITASHPMDSDLRQGVKALANTVRAVKRGGVMITYVKANEGVGVFGLANKKIPIPKPLLKLLAPLLVRLVPKLKLKGMGEEDRFFLYFALQAMSHATLLMYAPTIPAKVQQNLPFLTFVNSPEEGIAKARRKFRGEAQVLVFPHGGITYPEV